MRKQTKEHFDAAQPSMFEQTYGIISHGEDCSIQTEKKSQRTIVSLSIRSTETAGDICLELAGVRKQLIRVKYPWLMLLQTSARLHFTCHMINCGKFSILSGR